jgi:hypothetical protein
MFSFPTRIGNGKFAKTKQYHDVSSTPPRVLIFPPASVKGLAIGFNYSRAIVGGQIAAVGMVGDALAASATPPAEKPSEH